jgi:hypothetical protein
MTFFNHFGFDRNTGAELLIVFRSLPQERGSALVVQTDALDPHVRDKIVAAAKSSTGTKDLHEVLHANLLNNNLTYLQYLHQNRLLVKRSVTDVFLKDRFNNVVNVAEYEQGLLQAVNNQRVSQAQAQAARLIREAEGYETLARERRARATEIMANAARNSPELTTAEAIRQALAAEQAARQPAPSVPEPEAKPEAVPEAEVVTFATAEALQETAPALSEALPARDAAEPHPATVDASPPPAKRRGRPPGRKSSS